MCLVWKNNVRAQGCLRSEGGYGWAPNMHDCQMTFGHEGLDLDPTEVNCCGWTKWVYMDGFRAIPDEICGVPKEQRGGKDFKEECCG